MADEQDSWFQPFGFDPGKLAADVAGAATATASAAVDAGSAVKGAVSGAADWVKEEASADNAVVGKAIHAAVDEVNQGEQRLVQAGLDCAQDHGVISAETAQTVMHAEEFTQGVREGTADLAASMVPGLVKT